MRRPRLNRLPEIFSGYGIFFVTCCTEKRANLLANPEIHSAFVTFCVRAKDLNVWIGRYVIMPDHIHFFVDCGEETLLSDWMKSLKNALSKTLKAQGYPAPHWQKSFFDHLVRSETSYGQKWEYIHENPVRANLVTKASDWPYQGEIAHLPFT